MKILIVEDEAIVAMSLQFLLELLGHTISGISDDLESTVSSLDREMPDLAFIDVKLARGASGLDVATKLSTHGIPCFFITGNIPTDPCPDLALGCIEKPYTEEALETALRVAEARRTGMAFSGEIPRDLMLY